MATSKESILHDVGQSLEANGLSVVSTDFHRPWGGFFVLDEEQIQIFAETYFRGEKLDLSHGKNSPKILVIGPNEQLSWQYHHRRAEIWKIVEGPVGVKVSATDEEPDEMQVVNTGEVISFDTETRHRLIGLNAVWGVVAEIWQHSDPLHPSDESDIVRLQDNYSRTSG